jgi:magnesium transporter
MLREPAGCTKSFTRGIRSGHVIVDCAHYTTEGRREDAPLSMPEAAERLGGDGFVWLALRDPSTEELEEVAQRFDLPPLAVEDAHESHQRPKIEDYDDDWFVVLKAASYDDARETVDFDEIQMFAGPSFAVVIRGGATNHLEGARKRLADRPQLLEQGPIAVVWAVLDTVVDGYEPVLDGLERDIEDVEKAIFEEGRDQTQRIYFLRRELGRFFRAVHPLLNALQELGRDTTRPETTNPMREYFRDVGDHLQRLGEELAMQRDALDGALNANLGAISVRQNDIVRKVSGWAAIGIVPTLIASIYGMNFQHMPELHWVIGYPLVIALMAGLSFTLWHFLHRWGWL